MSSSFDVRAEKTPCCFCTFSCKDRKSCSSSSARAAEQTSVRSDAKPADAVSEASRASRSSCAKRCWEPRTSPASRSWSSRWKAMPAASFSSRCAFKAPKPVASLRPCAKGPRTSPAKPRWAESSCAKLASKRAARRLASESSSRRVWAEAAESSAAWRQACSRCRNDEAVLWKSRAMQSRSPLVFPWCCSSAAWRSPPLATSARSSNRAVPMSPWLTLRPESWCSCASTLLRYPYTRASVRAKSSARARVCSCNSCTCSLIGRRMPVRCS
mmetsp:Transcript_26095/g.52722  ORF Transcript_26095/g.52722 Transcript_26095/m.52722 type:complete len:271 (+) Transcript_26095:425-1237(+)